MLRRNGPVVKSVESVLRLEGSLWRLNLSCTTFRNVPVPVGVSYAVVLNNADDIDNVNNVN